MSTRQCLAAILLATFATLLAGSSHAQVTTGTIVGTVKDSAGAVVPGATVTVTETGKQTSSVYTTDASGGYTAPFLIPGTYSLAVDMPCSASTCATAWCCRSTSGPVWT